MTNAAFLSIGEVMIRDTPADDERLERTRLVRISPAGSEFSIAIGVSRMGIPSRFVTRLPDNPYGRMVESVAKENGVDASHFAWAPRTEPIGRYLYEIGVTPRASVGVYQRKFSAASRLEPSMVNWRTAAAGVRLMHVSGISLGLAVHSEYQRNYLLESLEALSAARDPGALLALDVNYRGTLWSPQQMRPLVERTLTEHCQILITTIEDLAGFFGISYGGIPAAEIAEGKPYQFSKAALGELFIEVQQRYGIEHLALTKRTIVSSEVNRWQSALVSSGAAELSAEELEFRVVDRLGGGDAWASGVYAGLLEQNFSPLSYAAALRLGDAAISLQQTLMFDLPILRREEVESIAKGQLSQRVQR